jgi:serine/threonine protein kinase/Tol biopolymer transport system component
MIAAGARLGCYEIIDALGAGGMGEVYRAIDTNLKRAVAIKVLPESVATDRDRLARFQREAEVLASLNHPNIAAIYGLERSNGTTALVMELVEGPTLADRIAQGPIPVDEALPIAKQIAEALEAAHERGIIHRDLKPANIKLRPDGTVKVLDFGLAKALEPVSGSSGDATASPTITSPAMTGMGMLLGTAAYMSPEQARGKPVDKRSDIWAFGCVLYEMLTGKRAFEGEDVGETLAAVLRDQPDWNAVPTEVPSPIIVMVKGCLSKDPHQRVGDVAAVRFVLNHADALLGDGQRARSSADDPAYVLKTSAAAEAAAATSRVRHDVTAMWRRRIVLAVASALLFGALAAAGAVWLPTSSISPEPTYTSVTLPPDVSLSGTGVAITPDGRTLAIPAGNRLVLRRLDRNEFTPLSGTEGATLPFFSSDGAWVGFVAGRELRKIRLDGTGLLTLGSLQQLPSIPPSWYEDTILFGITGAGLFRVSASGGTPEPLTNPDRDKGEVSHLAPQMLPGGRVVLFTLARSQGFSAAVLSLDSTEWRTLPGVMGGLAQYVASGHIISATGGELEGTLSATPFDADATRVTGRPVPVAAGVGRGYSVSRDGTLAFLPPGGSFQRGILVLADRKGVLSPVGGNDRVRIEGGTGALRFSPDGTRIVASMHVPDDAPAHLWLYDIARGLRTRLTDEGPVNTHPSWTPDGSAIAFNSTREPPGIYLQPAEVNGSARLLLQREREGAGQFPASWSPDGRVLSFVASSFRTASDLWTLERDGKSTPLLSTPADERSLRLSPDGRWLTYQSNVSGQPEVYVRPYPGPGRTEIVSSNGGTEPRWAGSHELIYRRGREVVAVPLTVTGDTLTPDRSTVLFEIDDHPPHYDVSPDGRQFLMLQRTTQADQTADHVNIVQNWFRALQRLVPAN